MKKRLFSVLAVLMITAMAISPVSAGAAVKLSSVNFGLGSLLANGLASGLGSTTYYLQLIGSGTSMTMCVNQGGNAAAGQNYPHVLGTASQTLDGNSNTRRNGKSPFGVETSDDYVVSWSDAGCPNSNWSAQVFFVMWDHATIVLDDSPDFLTPVATYTFKCQTYYTGPNSTPSTFDDGTVSCTPE